MATDNHYIIEKIRKGFEAENGRFTNCALIFAYNGTGKTRLSRDFAHYNRKEGDPKHTLYYNAYTEDIFTWDNDLENGTDHHFLINQDSDLIQGLAGYDFSEPLHKYLSVFTDIDFRFHYDEQNDKVPDYVVFSKKEKYEIELNGEVQTYEETIENIKISRGEERLFVWCFFRCIIDQVLNNNDAFKNIEYIYIDDPMSSLDDNNVIAFAEQLYNVIRDRLKAERPHIMAEEKSYRRIKFVVSSHHALFFHAMLHGLCADEKLGKYYLSRNKDEDTLLLKDMSTDTPFYYNVAMMCEIQKAIQNNKLYTYHFTILRSIMEKIKEFFGHFDFRFILDGITYKGQDFSETAFSQGELAEYYSRVMNVLTHQGSMFSPSPMNEDNKELAKTLFYHLKKKYHFILPELDDERSEKEILKENQEKKQRKQSR